MSTVPVTEQTIAAALRRLPADHPFPAAVEVEGTRLTVPAGLVDAYAAAAVADFLREELLAAGRSFSFETVMSHRSKTDFFARARTLGYRTYLYFVATESPQLNVYRVGNRTALGGHDVPDGKAEEPSSSEASRRGPCHETRVGVPGSGAGFLHPQGTVDPVDGFSKARPAAGPGGGAYWPILLPLFGCRPGVDSGPRN